MPPALWRARLSTANGSSSGAGRSPADSPASQLSQAPQGGSNGSPKEVRSRSRREGGGPAEARRRFGSGRRAGPAGAPGGAAQHLDAGLLDPAVVLGQGGRGRHRPAGPVEQVAGRL